MAAKPRAHEIARDLGVDSKFVLARLKELGELVKSPSSTVQPPAARKLRAYLASLAEGHTPRESWGDRVPVWHLASEMSVTVGRVLQIAEDAGLGGGDTYRMLTPPPRAS